MSAVEAHLDQCVRCRQEVEGIRATLAIADMAHEVEPDAEFKLKTVRLLKQEVEQATARAPVFRPALAYAAVLVALGLLLTFFLPERATRVELVGNTEEFEERVEQYAQEIEFLAGTLPGADYETVSYEERAHLDKIELLAG